MIYDGELGHGTTTYCTFPQCKTTLTFARKAQSIYISKRDCRKGSRLSEFITDPHRLMNLDPVSVLQNYPHFNVVNPLTVYSVHSIGLASVIPPLCTSPGHSLLSELRSLGSREPVE